MSKLRLNSIYPLAMEELPVELKEIPEDRKMKDSEVDQPKVRTEAVQHMDKGVGRILH